MSLYQIAKMSSIQVNWPKWGRIINIKFEPLVDNWDRYLILYGSRGSSKSDFVAKKLVFMCLTEPYFKFILYRKQYNVIQESSYANIKATIEDLGLQSLFAFRTSPLSITCINGNKFIARGGDKPGTLKSIKDPTGVWYEEDVPDETDFATITLTIRSGKARFLQEIFTINPEVEGSPEDNWFWKRFFKGHEDTLSYRTTTTVIVEERNVDFDVTVHHSIYQDNRWLPDANKALIESYKDNDDHLYQVYAKGLWHAKQTGGNFYKKFNRTKNVIDNPKYDPKLPLHISFDFNVNPYVTLTVWQMPNPKTLIQIEEILLRTPSNDTASACREFNRKYQGHTAGLFVYGDPNGTQEDTRSEKGHNDYVLIRKELFIFRPSIRIFTSAPAVTMRGNFINTVFESNFEGLSIQIGSNCPLSINDYSYLKEASDGTKAKIKEKNKETGIQEEKYGHTSDAGDYLIIYAWFDFFNLYQRGGHSGKVTTGKTISKNNNY